METNLTLRALSSWSKAQVIELSPSFRGEPEASAWMERLAATREEEDNLIDLLDSDNHLVIAHALVTLERMGSKKLSTEIEKLCDRREKITLWQGSFSTSMDLGGLARRIKKKLRQISKAEFELVEKAAREFFGSGVVSTKCPRCRAVFEVDATEAAYEVRCPTSGCIRSVFRGI